MSESKGVIFGGAKYTLLASYVLNIIVCVIYVIGGTLMVSSAHMEDKIEKEKPNSHESKRIIKISGYMLITLAVIGIGLSWMGIYAVYREIYKLNLWMSIFAVIGLILTLLSQSNPVPIVIQTILTGCQIYLTMRLKQWQDYPMDNNPELGKPKPNENTAMVLNAK